MSRLIYFIRHGQTDWNAEGRLQGQADTDLNALGRSQATRNGETLASHVSNLDTFDFIASPLHRTRETMERVREAAGLPKDGYATDPRLMELNFGDWQGSTLEQVEAGKPGSTAARDADKWHFRPPGDVAESYEMLAERFSQWLATIDRPTVCVTHGGIIRSVFRVIGKSTPDEASVMAVPQDRILKCDGDRLDWF